MHSFSQLNAQVKVAPFSAAGMDTFLPLYHDEALWNKFLAYPLDLVTQTFKEREPEYASIAEALELECRRFLYVTTLAQGRHLVPSVAIDEYWHNFVLFTAEYQDFCAQVAGKFIHHYPIGGPDVEQEFDETRMIVESLFGEFDNSDLWSAHDAARSRGKSCCGS